MASSTPIKLASTNEDSQSIIRTLFATTKLTNATECQNVDMQIISSELPENLFDPSMDNIITDGTNIGRNTDKNNVGDNVPNINLQHPIDPTVLLPNEQFLFKRNFSPYEDQNSGKELKELLRSWNCEELYSELMRNITLALALIYFYYFLLLSGIERINNLICECISKRHIIV